MLSIKLRILYAWLWLMLFLSLVSITESINPSSLIYRDIQSGLAPTTYSSYSLITTQEPYNPLVKPTGIIGKNINVDDIGALVVSIVMSLRQIVSLDEKNQILTTSSIIYVAWIDPRLSWNPSNYSGTLYIQAPANKFWLPDLSIMNSAGSTNLISYASTQILGIDYQGYNYLTISLPSFQTKCALNVIKYPFDTQKCSIIVGSWSFSTNDTNFLLNEYLSKFDSNINYLDTSKYIEHPYLQLVSLKKSFIYDSSRFIQVNLLRNLNFQSLDISFDMTLKRRPMYVMINSIYINFVLNIVILMAFFMPFPSQIGLCMTSLMTFATNSLRISSDIPVQSEYLPWVNFYLLLSLNYTFIGFLWFVTAEYFVKSRKLPKPLKIVAIFSKKVMFRKQNVKPLNLESPPNNIKVIQAENKNASESDTATIEKHSRSKQMRLKRKQRAELEKKVQEEKEEFDSNVTALNYFVFFLLLLIIFSFNMGIWISIGY